MATIPIEDDASTDYEYIDDAAKKMKGALTLLLGLVLYATVVAPARAAGAARAKARAAGKKTGMVVSGMVDVAVGFAVGYAISIALNAIYNRFEQKIEEDPAAAAMWVGVCFAVGALAGLYIVVFTTIEFAEYRTRLREIAEQRSIEDFSVDGVEADD